MSAAPVHSIHTTCYILQRVVYGTLTSDVVTTVQIVLLYFNSAFFKELQFIACTAAGRDFEKHRFEIRYSFNHALYYLESNQTCYQVIGNSTSSKNYTNFLIRLGNESLATMPNRHCKTRSF
jgi:hypothetical protein